MRMTIEESEGDVTYKQMEMMLKSGQPVNTAGPPGHAVATVMTVRRLLQSLAFARGQHPARLAVITMLVDEDTHEDLTNDMDHSLESFSVLAMYYHSAYQSPTRH